ncbi:hypothetical protein F52700_3202 [Fusarium sp. NRRL 52700]|nr:hypothetical protein F52700_3202 [Fusarium sp. NRRL 52700]
MTSQNSSSSVEARLAAVERLAQRAYDRGEVENVFSKYMHLHNVFQDEQIKTLWVKRGTPGIHAQYTNVGVYTDYDSIMAYHSGRPSPPGKLILHETTTPLIEVAGDGETAKGFWLMAGVESGLADPKNVGTMPEFLYEPEDKNIDGRRVWTHWVWCHYALDFLKQDGQWKIWHFRCLEVTRAPFSENWITFAKKNQLAFDKDLAYFGNDGKAVFMPTPDTKPGKACLDISEAAQDCYQFSLLRAASCPVFPAFKPSPLTADLGHCSFHHRPNASQSITRATEMFSDSQLERLALLERVFSSISLVAVLLIFVTYGSIPRLRNPRNTFIVFASIANLGASIGTVIARDGLARGENSALCRAQSFLVHMQVTSVSWEQLRFTLFFISTPARGPVYGATTGAETNTDTDIQESFDPHVTAASDTQKLAATAKTLEPIPPKQKQQSSSSAAGSTKSRFWLKDPIKRAYLFTTFMFTLSVLVTWVPASITRIHSLLNRDVPYSYQVAIAAVMPLQGLWNALIFFTTSRTILKNVIRDKWNQQIYSPVCLVEALKPNWTRLAGDYPGHRKSSGFSIMPIDPPDFPYEMVGTASDWTIIMLDLDGIGHQTPLFIDLLAPVFLDATMPRLPPLGKLTLVVRKILRDEWQNKLADFEEQLSKAMRVDWKIDIDALVVVSYSAAGSWARENPGSMIAKQDNTLFPWPDTLAHKVSYVEEAIKELERNSKYHEEINKLASAHVLTIDLDEEETFNACGAKFASDGKLAIVFIAERLGSNTGNAFWHKNLEKGISLAPTTDALSFYARTGIREDYEPDIADVQSELKNIIKKDLTLVPNFKETYKKLKLTKEGTDFDQYIGAFILNYSRGLVSTLKWRKFDSDDMLQQALSEALENREVQFHILDEAAIEDGILYLQVGVKTLRITTTYAAWVKVPGSAFYHSKQQEHLRKITQYSINRYGMHIIIRLHSLPGGVNNLDIGEAFMHDGWFYNSTNLASSWKAVDKILDFIKSSGHKNAFTIAPVNEASDNLAGFGSAAGLSDKATNWILTYMNGVFQRVESVDKRIPVMLQDNFKGAAFWSPLFDKKRNLVIDSHVYYFAASGTFSQYVAPAVCGQAKYLAEETKFPVFVGEWSLQTMYNNTLSVPNRKTIFDTQRYAWQKYAAGGAFWTTVSYATKPVDGQGTQRDYWSYVDLVRAGVITKATNKSYC